MRGYHIRISLQPKHSDRSLLAHNSDIFIPTAIFQRLPNHPPKSSLRRNTLSKAPADTRDYRLGPICLDWIDFDNMSSVINTGKEKERGRGPVEATFVTFAHKKSGTTNLPEGVVHIFRDGSNKPSTDELAANLETLQLRDEGDGITLGVLAVPSWMTPSDFLSFVAPAVEGIQHIRIIRDFAPNRSIALLKFPNPAEASEFIEAYNGKPFNSMEPELCHVVHVLSVEIDVEDSLSQAIARLSSSTNSNVYEIPTCPVCLERMDSAVTGLVTVPCSHTFHCMCLSKWGDSRCPVCRYSQTLLSSHPTSSTSPSTRSIPFSDPSNTLRSSCASCTSTANLWICLICGNIGCGRYGQAHAQAHYQATTHLYALELETQRVWDYAGDGYVHRLIQNRADGKLVELPSAASSMGSAPREAGLGPSQADALTAEKIEAIGIEYSYLLTSQLDSQRSYYEQQEAVLRGEVEQLRSAVERLSLDFHDAQLQHKQEEQRIQQEEEAKIAQLLKAKTKAENRADKFTELSRKLDKELKEERAVSEGLMKKLTVLQEQVKLAEKEKQDFGQKIKDLEDQVRDVMFYLETSKKIEEGGGVASEAAGGSIELVPSPAEQRRARSKSKKGKKG